MVTNIHNAHASPTSPSCTPSADMPGPSGTVLSTRVCPLSDTRAASIWGQDGTSSGSQLRHVLEMALVQMLCMAGPVPAGRLTGAHAGGRKPHYREPICAPIPPPPVPTAAAGRPWHPAPHMAFQKCLGSLRPPTQYVCCQGHGRARRRQVPPPCLHSPGPETLSTCSRAEVSLPSRSAHVRRQASSNCCVA